MELALLKCDTPLPSVLAEHGDYQQIFFDLLTDSNSENVPFTLDSFDVVHKMEYPEKDYDGIIISGSAWSAYAEEAWIEKLVKFVADVANTKPHIKIIGICFGHQIVARALGGECVPNDGNWEAGISKLDLTEHGKHIFGVPTLNIQQMHRDHVPRVPPNFHLLGSTQIAHNQGMVRYLSKPTNPRTSSFPSFLPPAPVPVRVPSPVPLLQPITGSGKDKHLGDIIALPDPVRLTDGVPHVDPPIPLALTPRSAPSSPPSSNPPSPRSSMTLPRIAGGNSNKPSTSPPPHHQMPTPKRSQTLPPSSQVHILTLQGHPEFTSQIADKIITARGASGVIDRKTVEEAGRREREGWRNDGVGVVGRAIWGVFGVTSER